MASVGSKKPDRRPVCERARSLSRTGAIRYQQATGAVRAVLIDPRGALTGDLMEIPNQPHLVPGRACGSCMMCCKVPYIKEFEKPAGVWCKHAVAGKGCGIYESRPGS